MDLHIFAIDSPYNKAFIDFLTRNFNVNNILFVLFHSRESVAFPLPNQKNIIYHAADTIDQYKSLFSLFDQSNRLIVHSLFEPALSVFSIYPGNKKLLFVPWGSDIAPFIFRTQNDRLDIPTRRFFQGEAPPMARTTFEQMSSEFAVWRKMDLVARKIARTMHVVPFEQAVLNHVFKLNLPPHLPFQYHNPVDFSLLDNEELPANPAYHFKKRFARVIQLNHSGNPANNHISLIDRLAELDRDDFCVVAPLSYGPPQIIEAVIKYGAAKLGERFFPIKEFLPPPQYAALLRQVDVLLMNTFYSGGTANMNSMLHLGRKVMLNAMNASSHMTFKVFNITVPPINPKDSPEAFAKELFTDLDEETKKRNRQQISDSLGEQKLASLYPKLLADPAGGRAGDREAGS
jgi:hypothetical protein